MFGRGVPEGQSDIRAIKRNFPYLLTQRSRVLLEMLTGSQLVKKLPAFYRVRRLVTAFTGAHHLSLS